LQLSDFHISISNSDQYHTNNLLDGLHQRDQTHGMKFRFLHHIALRNSLLLSILLLAPGASLDTLAQAPPKTTLAIFSDRRMPEEMWSALFTALRTELSSGAPEMQALVDLTTGHSLDDQVKILRGDKIVLGLEVESPIPIFLHVDCNLAPRPSAVLFRQPPVTGALGWVRSDHGHIEPFAHVDCTRIAQMLGPQAQHLNSDQRNKLMARAIARVILHEWIHIATQRPSHTQHGVTKAQFSVNDLAPYQAEPAKQGGTR
jgi:hypothetical protein